MDQVSAFAAYKSMGNGIKKKSPNKKSRPQFVAGAQQPKKNTNGVNGPPKKKMKKMKKTDQPRSAASVGPSTPSSRLFSMSSPRPPPTLSTVSSTARLANDKPSNQKGLEALQFLLRGIEPTAFFSNYWEKEPMLISGRPSHHYDRLKVSTEAIDEMLRTKIVEYTKNLDVTSYQNGERETHNPDGRAVPAEVWNYYREGCSIRLLNPQAFIPRLHQFNATLQEYFHCLVGANIYLTPRNSQGFAPHYDDIEAFVLQIEGEKEWSVYPPRNEVETLPRESSDNFQQDEIGAPALTVTLRPGDLLYFPRGWIHQAKTVCNKHSLHITLSAYQKTSYADLFEELTAQAVKTAINSELQFRDGLPIDIWNHFGETYRQFEGDQRRTLIKNGIKHMFNSLIDHLDVDDAVDKLAIKYQREALPPFLNSSEMARTGLGTKAIVSPDGKITMEDLKKDTEIRLLRQHILRLTHIDGVYKLYFYSDNSTEYQGNEVSFMEVDETAVNVVKRLIQIYPAYIKIRDLPEGYENAMSVSYSLWDRGLIITKTPLQSV